MFISNYWKPVKIFDWYNRLCEVETRAGTDKFSIVYRFYSTEYGPVRYVGRSDSPFNRENRHFYQIRDYGIHERLGGRIFLVDFMYITGKGRFRKSYEEECKQYHIYGPDLNINHPHSNHHSWKCQLSNCKN